MASCFVRARPSESRTKLKARKTSPSPPNLRAIISLSSGRSSAAYRTGAVERPRAMSCNPGLPRVSASAVKSSKSSIICAHRHDMRESSQHHDRESKERVSDSRYTRKYLKRKAKMVAKLLRRNSDAVLNVVPAQQRRRLAAESHQ